MDDAITRKPDPVECAPTLCRITLPSYSLGQERFNTISHAVGVALGVFALGWMIAAAQPDPAPNVIAGIAVYGAALIVLYAISALYHGLPEGNAKRVFRVLDHCSIYLLIAGCYTPVLLIAFWGYPFAVPLLAAEWGIAAAGILANAVNMAAKPVKIGSIVSYLAMGWAIAFIPWHDLITVGAAWLPWVAAGGLAYTVGIVFYIGGKKRSIMHGIWHMFVLAGSVLQMVGFLQML
ncbi:PAQR family membrane homeostasis protein TrhA, partial [Curtanaerobium respiraculi]|uniref:PAQR family membrane homeostasis protein TrhA n=1 Tax=Curtanaerobium respiraculi TaxID=2949669 RepID=UPI0024B3439D